MRLEADDCRPETSPPPRRGVQTADRAVVRERQAIPGDQGRARHRAIDPAALGPWHPRQRLHPGRGQPRAWAGRAGRAGETQQAVGDGGGRFRTSGAGIRTKAGMIRANAARYPISARCGMPGVPCSTCYWMIGRPGTERVDPVAGDVRAVRRDSRGRHGARKIKATLERMGVIASGRRIGGIMRGQGMRACTRANGPNRMGRGPTRPGPRTCWTAGSTATSRTRVRRAILPLSASAEAGRTCACWPAWRTGVSPAIPPGGPGTRAWCWPRSPPSTSR